jgi:hypothetical protein
LTHSSGTWTSTTKTITDVETLGLSTDGSTLVAGGYNMWYELNPTDLTTADSAQATAPASLETDCAADPCFDSMARTSRGDMIALDSTEWRNFYFYNPNSNLVASSEDYFGDVADHSSVYGGRVVGSQDGHRILITAGVDHPHQVYDDISRKLIPLNLTGDGAAGLSADGKVIVLGMAILKDSGSGYVSHGNLPETPASVAVSRDGRTVYLLRSADTVVPYDIAVANTFTAGSPLTLTAAPGANPKMTIAPDGDTLFVAGDSNIVIQPLP